MLEDVKEGVDYRNATALVDNREIDSFDILAIISAIDDEFDLSVPAKDIVPANFNSAQSLPFGYGRLVAERIALGRIGYTEPSSCSALDGHGRRYVSNLVRSGRKQP